jgi:Domain of unknown function (DUF5615)
LKLLLDEMYSATLAQTLRATKIDASTAAELGLAGRSDPDLFTTAVEHDYTLLTENAADVARIAADHLTAGQHHPGVLVALSSRFSRRPAGIARLAAAIRAVADERLDDRFVYLEHPDQD